MISINIMIGVLQNGAHDRPQKITVSQSFNK